MWPEVRESRSRGAFGVDALGCDLRRIDERVEAGLGMLAAAANFDAPSPSQICKNNPMQSRPQARLIKKELALIRLI